LTFFTSPEKYSVRRVIAYATACLHVQCEGLRTRLCPRCNEITPHRTLYVRRLVCPECGIEMQEGGVMSVKRSMNG